MNYIKIILDYKFKEVMNLMEDGPHYKCSNTKIRSLSLKTILRVYLH